MKPRTSEILFACALTVLLSFKCFCEDEQSSFVWNKQIIPGINYSHSKKLTVTGPLHVHILKVDLKNDKVNVKPELAKGVIGSLERTSDIAIRSNAIAAINGSFFETRKKLHLPVGFMVINGQVVNKSILERTAVGITRDKEIIFGIPKTKGYVLNLNNKKSVPIWGVNRPRKKDEVIIYTAEYGNATGTNDFGKEIIVGEYGSVEGISEGNSAIPKNGFVVSLHGWSRDFAAKTKDADRIGLVYGLAEKWKDVVQAITGGPLLVKDGVAVHKESLVNEKFKNKLLEPSSRTAVGISKDGELILVVVDGSRPPLASGGVTYDELAEIMKEAGAENAIGLDGGHTSAMYINGRIMNYPLTGTEGLVSNAIIVTYDGWKLASIPRVRLPYRVVYRPPSDEMIEALKSGTDLTPTAYVPRPEDFGMYGLYDIYTRVIRPVIPVFTIQQPSSAP